MVSGHFKRYHVIDHHDSNRKKKKDQLDPIKKSKVTTKKFRLEKNISAKCTTFSTRKKNFFFEIFEKSYFSHFFMIFDDFSWFFEIFMIFDFSKFIIFEFRFFDFRFLFFSRRSGRRRNSKSGVVGGELDMSQQTSTLSTCRRRPLSLA